MAVEAPFPRLRAAAVDERLLNPYLRREQLERLFNAIRSNSQSLCDAAVPENGITKSEAAVELHLVLSTVREHFSSIDPKKDLEDEYLLAHGKDAPERRKPFGIVYIEPCAHTLTYSVVSAISAAIAASNCVLLQVENTLQTLPKLLRDLLVTSLDADVFDTCTSRPDNDFLSNCLQVLQRGSDAAPTFSQLVSPASERVVAVVDRTANLEEAARALVLARFAFNGKSPYAPDIVLVNEFVEKAFLEAAVRHAIGFLENGDVKEDGSSKRSTGRGHNLRELLEQVQNDGEGHVVSTGERGTIATVKKRKCNLLTQKITQNALLVHAVTSLDDAITYANKNGTLAAAYCFANLPTAKYLSQFIDGRVAFANHIPSQLLLGPIAPMNLSVSPQMRYPMSAFSTPRPQFVNPAPDSAILARFLQGIPGAKLNASTKLPQGKARPEGAGIGFFEQGLMVGAFIVASPILVGVAVGSVFGYRSIAARLLG